MMPKMTSKVVVVVFFFGGGGGEGGTRLVTFYGNTKFCDLMGPTIGKLLRPIESYQNLGDSQILV